MNRLAQLINYGQSFWYDNIRRLYLQDGTLQTLRDQDGMRGLTSNPSIFDKAIAGSDDYDEQISELAAQGLETEAIYEGLALADIRAACDLFADLYQSSQKGDGYVSLEVSPHLADDTAGTVAAARRLFAAVGRPNLMIKVPATPAGIPAMRQLIAAGINVNATLMFSMAHYEAVIGAFSGRLGRAASGRLARGRNCVSGLVFRQPGGHRSGQTTGGDGRSAGGRSGRQGGHCQCQTGLPTLSGTGANRTG